MSQWADMSYLKKCLQFRLKHTFLEIFCGREICINSNWPSTNIWNGDFKYQRTGCRKICTLDTDMSLPEFNYFFSSGWNGKETWSRVVPNSNKVVKNNLQGEIGVSFCTQFSGLRGLQVLQLTNTFPCHTKKAGKVWKYLTLQPKIQFARTSWK